VRRNFVVTETKKMRRLSIINNVSKFTHHQQRCVVSLRAYSTTKLERAATESREKLLRLIDAREPLTDEEIISSVTPLLRPIVKHRMDEMRYLLDHYAAIRDEELVKRGKKEPTNVSPSLLLKIFGYYRKENFMESSIESLWDTLDKHITTYFPQKLYLDLNMPTPEANWLNSEFYIWTFHLWALYRRLRFEGADGEFISNTVCERFWRKCELKMSAAGIPGGIMHTELRKLQSLHYGVCIALDEALTLGQDADAMIAEVIWRNLYSAGSETVYTTDDGQVIVATQSMVKKAEKRGEFDRIQEQPVYLEAKYLLFWVRYLRYLLSWMDHIESRLFLKGIFELHSPTSDLVQNS
jgi:hypothetical protein